MTDSTITAEQIAELRGMTALVKLVRPEQRGPNCQAVLEALLDAVPALLDAAEELPFANNRARQAQEDYVGIRRTCADLEKRLAEAEHDYAEEHAIVERSIVFEEGQAARIAELERQLAETELDKGTE